MTTNLRPLNSRATFLFPLSVREPFRSGKSYPVTRYHLGLVKARRYVKQLSHLHTSAHSYNLMVLEAPSFPTFSLLNVVVPLRARDVRRQDLVACQNGPDSHVSVLTFE